jgi:hypothetical protein
MGILLLSFEFLSERRIKIAKTIQTFDAIKPEKWFKMLEIKTVIHRLICQSFSASGLLDLPRKTLNRRFRRVAQF